ncbi:MAG: type IV toxin-antitoxin system AbiEi family antitoxin domain-containing protein [Solirubrobacterales bacterium]
MRKRVDSRCDREVARRAAGEWGVLTTAELLACGLTHPAISRRRRRGWLHQLYTGVWAVGHENPPFEGRLLAAVKACGPGAVLSHRSAAQLWGFLDPSDRCPEVTVVGTSVPVLPGIVVHRTSDPGPGGPRSLRARTSHGAGAHGPGPCGGPYRGRAAPCGAPGTGPTAGQYSTVARGRRSTRPASRKSEVGARDRDRPSTDAERARGRGA